MVEASTAPPAVAAAVSGFIAVGSSSAADAARRPARPLKRSRKDQAAEAAGQGWAQEEEEGGAEPAVVAAGRAWQKLLKTSFNTFANPRLLSKDATRLMF